MYHKISGRRFQAWMALLATCFGLAQPVLAASLASTTRSLSAEICRREASLTSQPIRQDRSDGLEIGEHERCPCGVCPCPALAMTPAKAAAAISTQGVDARNAREPVGPRGLCLWIGAPTRGPPLSD